MADIVVLEDVVKQYRGVDRVVINDLTLRVPQGSLVALEGPSGTGKSTLLRLIAGVITPDSGTVKVFGQDLSELSEGGRAGLRLRRIGFIFQDFKLLDELTVLDNVVMPALLAGVKRAEARDRALVLLRQVGLDEMAKRMPDGLSGGEQQRVAVARSLILEPELILADEPTGNLDTRSGLMIMRLLRSVHQRGTTIIVVTHDHELASRCQQQLAMVDGRLPTESEFGAS